MRIRCIKLQKRNTTGEAATSDGWLTVGKEYLVLCIYGKKESSTVSYRVLGDDSHTPAMHDAAQFEIVSPKIPSDWVFELYPTGGWSLEPSAWAAKGFWEAYFDREKEAVGIFEKEFAKITEDWQRKFNRRQYQLMVDYLLGYEQNKVDLPFLVSSLKSLLSVLEQPDKKWKDEFLNEWDVLEAVYAIAIDRKEQGIVSDIQTVINEDQHKKLVGDSVRNLSKLLQNV